MQAYSNNNLNNLDIRQQAEEAFEQGIINEQSIFAIKQANPFGLYTPAFFIRVALALLCIVCVSFAAFLCFLVLYQSNNFLLIFLLMFLACYVLLEYMVKTKKYYNAGIDNVLQVFSIVFFAGMFADGNYAHQDVVICIAVIVSAAWLAIRFADSFIALVAFAAILYCIFLVIQPGNPVYSFIPFIFMLVAAIVYLLQQQLNKKTVLLFYKKCFYILSVAALVSIYAAGNVYVVSTLSKPLVSSATAGSGHYTVLWIVSILIPVIYMVYGFIKQRILFLRIGFLCGIATILTIHFYYSVLSPEAAFITGGFVLIIIGYVSLTYFKNSKHGFTAKSYTTLNKNLVNIETLISMQVGGKHLPQQNMQFGGGSSGGAGASGNW